MTLPQVVSPAEWETARGALLYHHMLKPGDDDPCSGCSLFVDNIGHLAHLHARDTSLVLVSRAPSAEIEAFTKRMGWTVPWFSSAASGFDADFGVTTSFGLDLTPLGRQEDWGGFTRGVAADAAVRVVAPAR